MEVPLSAQQVASIIQKLNSEPVLVKLFGNNIPKDEIVRAVTQLLANVDEVPQPFVRSQTRNPDKALILSLATNPASGAPVAHPKPIIRTVRHTREEKERRKKICKILDKEIAQSGIKFYVTVPLNLSEPSLPFICATLDLQHPDDEEIVATINATWCLWDHGATVCYGARERIPDEILANQGEEFVTRVDVKFNGADENVTVYTTIAIKPRAKMPNGTDFFILGQAGLINRIQHKITPRAVEVLPESGEYGAIELIKYNEPASGENISF